jgi:hypothetical protein
MVWLLAVLFVGAVVVLAGRAHSRYLDRLEDLHARGYLNDQRLHLGMGRRGGIELRIGPPDLSHLT